MNVIADEQEAATVEGTEKEATSSYKAEYRRSWHGQVLVVPLHTLFCYETKKKKKKMMPPSPGGAGISNFGQPLLLQTSTATTSMAVCERFMRCYYHRGLPAIHTQFTHV